MIKTVVAGAAGRMGRRLVDNIINSEDMQLVGAFEVPGCPLMGSDAGSVACGQECGVKITTAEEGLPEGTDAVITFATGGVIELAREAAAKGASIVIGTTALPKEVLAELEELAAKGARIVQAGNMSVGANLLMSLAKKAAGLLGDNCDIEITEMHHNQKKDAPSGTAMMLAKAVCEAKGWNEEVIRHGREGVIGARPGKEIGMHSLRGGDVVGDHTVIFAMNGERIELTHKASSRDMFSNGALRAVRFLATAEPGKYDMPDVLNLK